MTQDLTKGRGQTAPVVWPFLGEAPAWQQHAASCETVASAMLVHWR